MSRQLLIRLREIVTALILDAYYDVKEVIVNRLGRAD